MGDEAMFVETTRHSDRDGTRYYDRDRMLPVPTGPWVMGDLPQAGKVHVKIYTGGRKFGPVQLETHPYGDRQYDAMCEFDRGPLALSDPSDDHTPIYGQRAGRYHDGYCGLVKLKTATMNDQVQLTRTLVAACQAGIDTVNAARARAKIMLPGEAYNTVSQMRRKPKWMCIQVTWPSVVLQVATGPPLRQSRLQLFCEAKELQWKSFIAPCTPESGS
jgi:hypothetical protein